MPDFMDSATSVADGSAEDLKSLLGGEAEEATATEEESEQPAVVEETEVADGEDAAAEESEESGEQSDEESSDEETEDAAESEEAEEEDEEAGELELGESDHDYSQAAYERAAKVFSKNLKLPADKQFDPNDPKDRAALKEMMDRGESFKTLKQELEQAKAGKTDDKKEATEGVATTEALRPPTEEEIKTFVDQSEQLAKASLVPQVSMRFATSVVNVLAKALWGKDAPKEGLKLSQEEADSLTTALGAGFNMMLMQNSGVITNGVKSAIFADRGISNAVNVSTREIGLQTVGEKKDAKGAALYPDLGDLVESGKLKAVFNSNPSMFLQIKAGDGSDPAANYAAQVEAAIKIARGEGATSQVSTAVATGKKQAELRAKRLGASRVAAGNTKGIRKDESYADRTVREITSGSGGGKFEAAVEREAPMRRK